MPMPRMLSTQPPTEPRISDSAGRIWWAMRSRKKDHDQVGITPAEYEPPMGSSFRRKAMKNSSSTPMITGGTPVNRMKGAAMVRSQRGDFGQAATAPRRLPMMKLRMVVTSSSARVHGIACRIRSVAVAGYLFSE